MKYSILMVGLLLISVLISGVQAAEIYDSSSTSDIQISLINQNPYPARAGEIVELRFLVENIGGTELNNVNIEFIPDYPFTEIVGENYTKNINRLFGYQQGDDAVIVKYKVMIDKDATRGVNEVNLKVTYNNLDFSFNKKFDVEVSGTEFAQIIYIDKAKISPGEETDITFTITNVGNSPLKNLVFSWEEENGVLLPVYSDNTKYVKYIDAGESTELIYKAIADVNTDAGLYQLDLSLVYETDDGGSHEISTTAGIFIGGETDFDVTFSESSAGQTSLSVANTGNNPALSVTVRIPDQDNFQISGSSSSIIGNLDKGDYTIVSFQISSMPSNFQTGTRLTENNYTRPTENINNDLRVIIQYTDTTGERHEVEKYVPIQFRDINSSDQTTTFRQRTNSMTSIIYYIVIIVVVIIGVVVFKKRNWIRKKKKKESKAK